MRVEAEAYRADVPDAEMHLLDAWQFRDGRGGGGGGASEGFLREANSPATAGRTDNSIIFLRNHLNFD
jgi:hypothetical protein